MLLDRAASYFEGQGYRVRVRPCIIGDTGAIHAPDLHLVKEGQRQRVVFVFDALDGSAPLETRAHMAKDMDAEVTFVIGEPSAEVRGWVERRKVPLLEPSELPVLPEAPAPPPAPKAPPAPVVAPAPPPAPEPVYVPDDGGAMLLPGRKRQPEMEPMILPEDDGAVLLTPRAPAPEPVRTLPIAVRIAPAPVGLEDDGGAELLASRRQSPRNGDAMAKHDPSIWDPRSRLAEVQRVARAGSFDSTGGGDGPASAWLKKLRDAQSPPSV